MLDFHEFLVCSKTERKIFTMKKALSLVMCIIMLVSTFSVLSVTASAADADDLMYVKSTAFSKGQVTYTIYLNKGVSLIAAINKVVYDPEVLTPVSGELCGDYANAILTSGPVDGVDNAYTMATVNGSDTWKSDINGYEFMKITFKVIGDKRPTTTVKFSCVEFNSPNSSQKIRQDHSNPSPIATIKTTTLDVISMKSVTTDDGGLKISWNKTTGAEGYRIYKYVSGGWKAIKDINDGDVTSYIDKTVEHNTTAKYTVRAFVVENGEIVRDSATGKSLSARYIMAPKTVKVASVANGIKVAWTGVSGATSYRVYRRELNEDGTKGSWTLVRTAGSKERNYTDKSGLVSGTKYQYVVRAVTKNGTSAACRDGIIWYYAAPTVSISSVEGGAKVKWNKITGATSYKIYRRYKTSDSWKHIKTVSGSTFTYTDASCKSVGTVYYTVRAYSENGSGGFVQKNAYYVKTPIINTPANTTNAIKVTWGKVSGASGYYVYRKAGSATKWTNLGKVKSTSYTDKNVKSGTNYTYTVRAYYGKYLSGFDTDGVTIKRLSTPALSKVANTADGVKFTWSKVAGAEGYKVYRKTSSSGWSCVGTVSAASFTDSTAKSGTTYTYTVRAYSGKTMSAYNTKGLSIKCK